MTESITVTEKLVQLSFTLPQPTKSRSEEFITSILANEPKETPDDIIRLRSEIRRRISNKGTNLERRYAAEEALSDFNTAYEAENGEAPLEPARGVLQRLMSEELALSSAASPIKESEIRPVPRS